MFGVEDYWAFVVAVIVFLAIPGVGNLAIITSTTKGRIVGGLAATMGVIVISITHFAADRMRASPRVSVWLNRVAGAMLLGFGVKLALGK